MNKIYLFLALSLLVLACNQKTVEQEMDEYCSCKQTHRQTDQDFKECNNMIQAISEKYEFDPGAADFIQERLKTCD
ncbi:MAG: hypothetical protein K0R65_1070 [Crocinitomicaceae bacterium]|jgi:hypothetical protein|nr:hypothetical protein [Crocinitomicaceae bacterium]